MSVRSIGECMFGTSCLWGIEGYAEKRRCFMQPIQLYPDASTGRGRVVGVNRNPEAYTLNPNPKP